MMKVLLVLPNVVGFSGSAVNERQLAKALSKYVEITTYALIPVLKIPWLLNRSHLARVKGEAKLSILLPVPTIPYSLGLILTLSAGCVFALLAAFRGLKLVYVRSSTLALPFMLLKKLHRALVYVKIPAIPEDEISRHGLTRASGVDKRIFQAILGHVDRYVIIHADRILVGSLTFYHNLVKRRRAKNPKPPILVPAGIDMQKLCEVHKPVTNLYKDEDVFTIGFVGLLEWWQGLDILVKAAHMLKSKVNRNVKVLIVGDGPMRGTVEKLCKELNVKYMITGLLPHEKALEAMTSMDVLAVPRVKTSTTENIIPMKIIEAWALGIPVITTNHKIYGEMGFKNGVDLVLCEPNPASVAEAMRELMENLVLRKKLRSRGPKIAEFFSYDQIARQLTKIANEEV